MTVATVAVMMMFALIVMSVYSFVTSKTYQSSYFSYQIFVSLLLVYVVVLIGFGFIYFWLSIHDILLIEFSNPPEEFSLIEAFAHAFYFSGVTLMTVGYGDITPIGWGRIIALIEALIGYILPAAFIFKIGQHKEFVQANKKIANRQDE
ncbi:Ion channel [Paraliobacillus sp. PM-2]|uniref:potassium channel family protein n=1 Tax=Paraliobacillus sp. PM-2 TaxID=1462524 RepID=UPI00061CCABC|nr:potassium channel family protein [Paraliobacillus sp. PM-2]CQR47204.1 Ion channel [Paraliobacillus sp. PM-2]